MRSFFFWRLTYYESLSAYRVAGWEKFPYNTSMMWGMENFEGIRVFFFVECWQAQGMSKILSLHPFLVLFTDERTTMPCLRQWESAYWMSTRWKSHKNETMEDHVGWGDNNFFLLSNRSNDGANTMWIQCVCNLRHNFQIYTHIIRWFTLDNVFFFS